MKQPAGRGGEKARLRRRARPFSRTQGAIFGALALLLVSAGVFLASGMPGGQGMGLQKIYAALSSFAERRFSPAPPEKNDRREPAQPPAAASPGAPPAGEARSEGGPEAVKKASGKEKPAGVENAASRNPFVGGRMVIPFGFNVNELPPEVTARLDELSAYLERSPRAEIVIKGYTDAQGSKDYNRNLSAFRANVVKSYLTGKGVNPDRMKVIGMGDEGARMPNTTAEGRSANRRVEIELAPPKP
jgi:outer membrane protein OmpA-like peptidoglycan-associated protein